MAVRVLAYASAAALALLAALVLSVELSLVMALSGRTVAIAQGLSWVVWAILLVWMFLGPRRPAEALDRACRAGLVVSALFPLCLIVSMNLSRSDWADLGGLGLGLAMGFLLLALSLVVNPGLCAAGLLAQRALEGVRKPTDSALPPGRVVATYVAVVATCALLARHAPFTLAATAAATAAGLGLMAWPRGAFALRAGIGLAGPYAPLTGAAALAAPVLAGVLWSLLAKRPREGLRGL